VALSLLSRQDLRSLNVGRCGVVSDRGLAAIGRGCRGLQSLNIAGAARVSEGGLCELARGCVGLQVLNINGCTRITKNGLQVRRHEEGCWPSCEKGGRGEGRSECNMSWGKSLPPKAVFLFS
jgi:hypothetical protein